MAAKKVILTNLDNVGDDYEWYTIVTTFNMEEQYVRNVKEAVMGNELENLIAEYYVPIKYVFVKPKKEGNKPKIRKEKSPYSNYVFVRCKMTDDLWALLRTTTGAAVILTSGGTPIINSNDDINHIKKVQMPFGFERQEAIDLLKKLWDENIKIIPGINDGHPENRPSCDVDAIEKWYDENVSNSIERHKKDEKEKLKSKPLEDVSIETVKKTYKTSTINKTQWDKIRNKFKGE